MPIQKRLAVFNTLYIIGMGPEYQMPHIINKKNTFGKTRTYMKMDKGEPYKSSG